MAKKVCKKCNAEFETTDKRRKYCTPLCSRLSRLKDDPITGGGIKRKGNTVTVTGAINVMMYMRGIR